MELLWAIYFKKQATVSKWEQILHTPRRLRRFMKNSPIYLNLILILVSIFAILLKPLHTFAGGGMDGGGGRSVVCRDSKGQIVSAELFDFYEGRVKYRLNPILSAEPYEGQVEKIVQRVGQGRGPQFIEHLKSYTNFVIASKQILPDGTGLLPVEDSEHVISPPRNCQYEQLANFTAQNQVLINGEIWNALDSTNKAGLVLHEAIYKVFRNYGATNSSRARKAVAYTFSGVSPFPLWQGLPTQKTLKCHTVPNSNGGPFPGSSFYAYNTDDGQLYFQFDYLDGQLMLSENKLNFDKMPIEKILDPKDSTAATYWVTLSSIYDPGLGVAISFQPKGLNGREAKVMKIGIGNMPWIPAQEFMCGNNDGKKH